MLIIDIAALGAAKGFCTGLAFTPLDCNAQTTSSLPSSASSAPASTTPVTASPTSTPASGSTSSPVASPTSAASSTYSSVSGVSGVSGIPTPSSNGSVTTVPPAQTSVVVGSGSALQIGGAVMVGALLAAIAL